MSTSEINNTNVIILANAIELITDVMYELNGEHLVIGSSKGDRRDLQAAASAHLRNELVKNLETATNVI